MIESAIPWPWPDQPAPEPQTHWVRYDDGTLGQITTSLSGEPVLARPGRILTQPEYETLLAEMTVAHEQRIKQLEDADAARQVSTYRDLTAAGIPEPTARSLSGYEGPALVDGPGEGAGS